MKVRPARAKDAKRCAEISHIRPAEELKSFVADSDTKWLVIEDDAGVVVGIGIIHLWRWNKMAWVWDLTIDKRQRGKGYGTALLKGMIEHARKMGARVLMDFGNAEPCDLCQLYLNNGFRYCGSNDRWFSNAKESTAAFYGYDL